MPLRGGTSTLQVNISTWGNPCQAMWPRVKKQTVSSCLEAGNRLMSPIEVCYRRPLFSWRNALRRGVHGTPFEQTIRRRSCYGVGFVGGAMCTRTSQGYRRCLCSFFVYGCTHVRPVLLVSVHVSWSLKKATFRAPPPLGSFLKPSGHMASDG